MSEGSAVEDSSGWIKVFTNRPLSHWFLDVINDEASLVIPAISILTTAQTHQASLYTIDNDFQDLNDLELLTSS